jgi:hypothetical protein
MPFALSLSKGHFSRASTGPARTVFKLFVGRINSGLYQMIWKQIVCHPEWSEGSSCRWRSGKILRSTQNDSHFRINRYSPLDSLEPLQCFDLDLQDIPVQEDQGIQRL